MKQPIRLLSFIAIFLFLPLLVAHGDCTHQCVGNVICNPLCYDTIEELIDALTRFVFWVAMALTPVMVLIAALYLMTAGGNPRNVDTAKQIILYTCIGLAIVLFARGLSAVIKAIIGVTPVQPPTPTP